MIDSTYSHIDNLTWQHGCHLLSMGVQAIRYQNNYPTNNNYDFLRSLGYGGGTSFTSDLFLSNAPGTALQTSFSIA